MRVEKELPVNGFQVQLTMSFYQRLSYLDLFSSKCLLYFQGLVNWNALNSQCLLWAMEELLEKYRQHQESKVALNSRLQFEYSSLVETAYEPSDIEVHVTKRPDVSGKYCFTLYVETGIKIQRKEY